MKQFFQWMNQDENIRSAVAAFSQSGCHNISALSDFVTGALVAKGQNTRQLGVSGLPAGLYLLRATVQGQVLTQKIVIR